MKCYRTTKEFVRTVCREKGQSRPNQTWYLVEHERYGLTIQRNAPRSYDRVKRVLFCVDGERLVEKKFGVWAEKANVEDEEWLKQRLLRQVFDELCTNVPTWCLSAPYSLDEELKTKMDGFFELARLRCYDREFNTKVLNEALSLMEKDGCFSTLKWRGDPLNQAVV